MQGGGFPGMSAAQTNSVPRPTRLVYMGTTTKTYNTYADCYNEVLSKSDQSGSKVPAGQKANL